MTQFTGLFSACRKGKPFYTIWAPTKLHGAQSDRAQAAVYRPNIASCVQLPHMQNHALARAHSCVSITPEDTALIYNHFFLPLTITTTCLTLTTKRVCSLNGMIYVQRCSLFVPKNNGESSACKQCTWTLTNRWTNFTSHNRDLPFVAAQSQGRKQKADDHMWMQFWCLWSEVHCSYKNTSVKHRRLLQQKAQSQVQHTASSCLLIDFSKI